MSKPRYPWWSYAKAMIRLYPTLKAEYDAIHLQSVTSDCSRLPCGKSGVSRSTEMIALRQLPPARQREYDAVTSAIERTKRMRTGAERLAVVDLVLWKDAHDVAGAAYRLHISDTTARRYHSDFIRLVGFCYGLEDHEETKTKPRRIP